MSAWAPVGAERFGLFDGGGSAATANSGLQALSTPAQTYADETKAWHPSNPLLVLAVLGALTVGFAAVSTSGGASVRLGKVKATVTGGAGIGDA